MSEYALQHVANGRYVAPDLSEVPHESEAQKFASATEAALFHLTELDGIPCYQWVPVLPVAVAA